MCRQALARCRERVILQARLFSWKRSMSEAVGAGKTVLVVDDHEPTRQTIARMLEAGGFTVRTANERHRRARSIVARE